MGNYERYKYILVTENDRIATVLLNRPEQSNAIDLETRDEFIDILDDLSADDKVRAIILTGAGKAFSAGGDIQAMKAGLDDRSVHTAFLMGPEMQRAKQLVMKMIHLEKPIVAAVNGHAIGLGATIALLCDIVVASKTARIGDMHVNLGLVAGDGGTVIWPLLIGVSKAKEFLLTGDLITGEEAERIGLVSKAVPTDEVYPTALSIAQKLASGPPKAIAWTKLSINKWLSEAAERVLDTSLALEWRSWDTEDFREAVDAFLEKRKPEFKGR